MPSLEKLEIGDLVFEDFSKFWVKEWEKGSEDIETSDLPNPVYNDTYTGVDFHRGPTWTFEFIIEGDSEAEVLDNLDRVKAVWRDPAYTRVAGATTGLAFTVGGRRRYVFGRPRRFAESDLRTTAQGFITVLAEFKLTDPLQYEGGDNLGWITTRIDNDDPILTTDPVAGTAPTPFKCTIYGPRKDPGFKLNHRQYQFEMTLEAGDRLVIDSRTGTALLNGWSTQSQLYRMMVPTQLKNVRLEPGESSDVSILGTDSTGTSYAYFAYRPAFH